MPSPKFDAEIRGKAIARSSEAALRLCLMGERDWPPCPYPGHRETDWRRDVEHPVMCGVCHPPAPGVPVMEA